MSPMRWVDVVSLAQPAILSGLNEELEATEFLFRDACGHSLKW